MRRRTVVLGGIATALAHTAMAATRTLVQTGNGPLNRVYVQAPTVVRQMCPQWCWAASASMVFAMHGHPLNQMTIVPRVFGGLVCMPAPGGITIATVLNEPWTDDNGVAFKPNVVAAYDFGAGVVAIDNRTIVDEILNNRPLLYGNRHHAMVVCQVDYADTPAGPTVLGVGVLDPWPGSPEFHPLTAAEMQGQHLGGEMNFLAAVHI